MTLVDRSPDTARGTAVLLAAFDSQLKWCARIATELAARGLQPRFIVPDGRSALSDEQIAAAGVAVVERASWAEAVASAVAADVVVCALSGPQTRAFIVDLARDLAGTDASGPVVVTGWVGVIIEKAIAGYLDRCGSDVIAVNSRADLAQFQSAAIALGIPAPNLQLTGLPFLGRTPAPQRSGPIRRVVFADQPTVPARAEERLLLYTGLVDYARAHPERDVVLKPRHRPEEGTFHRMRHHPETLLHGIDLPTNFRIDYTSIQDLLPVTDLLLTISSTASLEALDRGCRVGLVLDLGVHERLGNQVFLHSGLLRTWQQLAADQTGAPEPGWLSEYFFPPEGQSGRTPTESLVDRIEHLRATGQRPSREVWASEYFRSAEVALRQLAAALERAASATPTTPSIGRRAARALLPPLLADSLRRVRRLYAGGASVNA